MIVQELEDSTLYVLNNRYRVLSRLGKQAGRITFLAEEINTKQKVVIKLLLFGNDLSWDDLKLFERETQTLKFLSHRAIPRYLDSFEVEFPHGKGFALVQSYIPAPSLEKLMLEGHRFRESETKAIVKAILDILNYLHQRQPSVIHRDLKPSNILLDTKTKKVYLVDFGSVQTLASREGQTVTVVGTYGYMPPEQFGGRAFPTSDLYSLGATAIALLTGKHPADLPQRNMQFDLSSLTRISPGFFRWLEVATQPSIENRFSSAATALIALEKPESALGINKQITTVGLFWGSFWRSLILGFLTGIFYGGIYGTVIFPIYGTVFGGMLGGFLGLIAGVANGFLMAIVTRFFFFYTQDSQFYQRIITFASTLWGMAGGIIILYYLNTFYLELNLDLEYYYGDWKAAAFFNFIPALIIGLSMGLINKLIARWYLNSMVDG